MLKQLLSLFIFTLIVNISFAQSSSAYCNKEVTHFAGDPGSEVFLTISNIDATSMYVEVQSANADPVDLLIVVGGSGASISAEDTSVPGKIRRTLTWGSPPTDVFLNVLWSKASFGGNWQLSTADINVPFAANCTTAPSIPTMGEWTLFILFLLIVNIAAVFIFSTQNKLALGMENQTISITSVLSSLPFDKSSFIQSLKHAFGIALIGFAIIYIFWGEIIATDFIGMAISIPLIAYFIHFIIGKKE